MEAIVLAGGLGQRLRSAVSDVPKPLAPVGGRPFLEHQLDYWLGQGIECFVLAVGYKGDVIRRHFGARYGEAEMVYAVEQELLGTGGAVANAARLLHAREPFIVLNGDTFFEVDLADLYGFHRTKGSCLTIALKAVPSNTRYGGVSVDAHGRIREFHARPAAPGETLINGGVYLLDPSVLDGDGLLHGERFSLEDDFIPELLRAGKPVHGRVSSGRFIDIGVPEDYRAAASVIGFAPALAGEPLGRAR